MKWSPLWRITRGKKQNEKGGARANGSPGVKNYSGAGMLRREVPGRLGSGSCGGCCSGGGETGAAGGFAGRGRYRGLELGAREERLEELLWLERGKENINKPKEKFRILIIRKTLRFSLNTQTVTTGRQKKKKKKKE